jgi:hypothetical protein
MSAENYIKIIRERNPKLFAAEKISMSVAEFERQIGFAYVRGGMDVSESYLERTKPVGYSIPDALRRLFK